MTPIVYVGSIVCAVVGLVVVVEMLRRSRLRERHAIWWLIAGLLALTIAVFPQILDWLGDLAGIEVPTNLIFFVSIALLFGVCLQLSSELTRHEDKIRRLAEEVAALHLAIGSAAASEGPEMDRGPDRWPDGDRDERGRLDIAGQEQHAHDRHDGGDDPADRVR